MKKHPLASMNVSLIVIFLAAVAGCTPVSTPTPTPTQVTPTQALPAEVLIPSASTTPTQASVPLTNPSATITVVPTATMPAPVDWKELPVIPEVPPGIKDIYLKGIQAGNNPNAFSKIGDCESQPTWFLGDFDAGPRYYSLGDFTNLQPLIDAFAGSFDRQSLASGRGFSTTNALTPFWADPKLCDAGETPLDCEYRIQKPSFALIMLGTNDVHHLDKFEPQFRTILEKTIAHGIIPIVSTKADNLEGDQSVNAAMVRIAQEYDVPVWNFWQAVQPLPDHGLQEDGAHITWFPNRFDDPESMRRGWPIRNLTALQALDAVWQTVTGGN